jgi:succinyl-CoA synthetase beta subunit
MTLCLRWWRRGTRRTPGVSRVRGWARCRGDEHHSESSSLLVVEELLVERCIDIAREVYAAVLNDAVSKGPLLIFSTSGGMDIEQVNRTSAARVLRAPIDVRQG